MKMRHKQINYICILFILFLLLYFTTQYLNHDNTTEVTKSFKPPEADRIVEIPSIVVYAKKKVVDINENCSQSYGPAKISVLWDSEWQKMGQESPLFLYSAYVDRRLKDSSHYIRIMAMSKGEFVDKLFCKIWQKKNSYVALVDLQELWVPNWDFVKPGEYYRPLLLSCSLPNSSFIPIAVSVVSEPCQEPNNVFWVNETRLTPTKKADFVLCVKPLDFQNDRSLRLLEWLELQFLLGADNITVYTYRIPAKMLKVLKHYQKSGTVTIKEHTLPGDSPSDPDERRLFLDQHVWQKRRHEMLIYNDCFYRHIATHKYVINLDLDEAIIPLVDKDWKSLLEHIFTLSPKKKRSAAISAPNVYFFKSFGVDSNDSIPEHFYMLRHIYRSANFTPPGFAQKSFCSTDYALSVSNHYALKALYPNIMINVAGRRDLVQLHHYRARCPPKMDRECEENYMKYRVKDSAILRFKDSLIKNVAIKIKDLNLTIPNT